MQKIIYGFYLLLLFSLSGCSKTVFTQQVVDNLHTKQDLLKQLGEPDQKVAYPGYEEWAYIRDTLSVLNNKNNSDTVSKEAGRPSKDSVKSTFYTVHHTYIKFHIDSADHIIEYKNNGVDLTRKVKENFGNTLLDILGGTLAVLLIVVIEVVKEKLND
jgi:hypothetical protein